MPWQDAVALRVNTTFDLQQLPIDILVNPSCDNDGDCTANGDYVNDDGLVLDFDGYRNKYTFNFTYTPIGYFKLIVNSTQNASNVD